MAPSKKLRKMNAHSKEWVVSSSTRDDLEEMVMDGILSDEVMAGWRPMEGERFPNPHAGEVVIFRIFIGGDLGFWCIHSCASFSRTMGFHLFILTRIALCILPPLSIFAKLILE